MFRTEGEAEMNKRYFICVFAAALSFGACQGSIDSEGSSAIVPGAPQDIKLSDTPTTLRTPEQEYAELYARVRAIQDPATRMRAASSLRYAALIGQMRSQNARASVR